MFSLWQYVFYYNFYLSVKLNRKFKNGVIRRNPEIAQFKLNIISSFKFFGYKVSDFDPSILK